MSHQDSADTAERPGAALEGNSPNCAPEILFDLFCQQCGYNLRGLTGNRCPECGHSLDSVRSEVSGIPWVHRQDIGRFRAYWKTVWLVMFRQRRFCDEMARQVSFADSQRFRWVTVLHVFVPALVAAAVAYFLTSEDTLGDRDLNQVVHSLWLMGVLGVSFLLFLAAATGLPSYFFHPREIPVQLQNRAIAMSYYACGPLSIIALPTIAWIISAALGFDSRLGLGLILFAILFPLGQMAAWWLDLIHITRRIVPQCKGRNVLVALAVPLLWLLLFHVILLGLPFAALFVILVGSSVG